MFATWLAGILFATIAPGSAVEEALEWSYVVNLTEVDGAEPAVTANLSVVFATHQAETVEDYWHLQVSKGEQLPFALRFGRTDFRVHEESGRPQVRVRFEERLFDVPVLLPRVSLPETIAAGQRWEQGDTTYAIVGTDSYGEKDACQIEVYKNGAAVMSLQVDPANGRPLALQKKVTVGRGDPFELTLSLEARRDVSAKQMETLKAWAAAITAHRPSTTTQGLAAVQMSDDAELTKVVSEMPDDVEGAFLRAVFADARRAAEAAARKANSLTQLRDQAIGRQLPKFELLDLAGERHSDQSLAGSITVLHIWKYRFEPLEPPYGQVGFLDYIARRADPTQVRVFGMTEVEAEDAKQRAAQVRNAKKLAEFMNLSFPVLIDDGELLQKLGDPRDVREDLPVWIVVDATGTIVEFRAGLFDVDAREGLAELQQWIKSAMDSRQSTAEPDRE